MTRSSLRQKAESLPYGVRVEVEDPTDGLKGVRPVCLVGEKPLRRLTEEPATAIVRREAMFLKTIERVVKNGDHEPVLGCLFAPPSEVLRRQHRVVPPHADRYSSHLKIRFHRHAPLVKEEWQCP